MTGRLTPTAARASRWITDPDFGTAYSYLRPGGTPADRDRLAGPLSPGVRLAGEATWAEHPGTVHGAWFSGERAADAVVAERAGRVRTAVVVGAGCAGIAAAHRLRAHGADVTVLEAGDAPGGRTRTDRSLGGPVHLGAAWLHGDEGNPLAELARRADVPTEPSQWGESTTFILGRGPLDPTVAARLHTANGEIDEAIDRAQRAGRPRDALGPVVHPLIAEHARDGTEHLVLESWVTGIYENLYAAPVDDLSLLYCDEPFRLPGRDLTLLGGLDTMVAAAVGGLDVRCRQRVTSVRAAGGGWRVATDTGSSHTADAVVVTVAVAVLHTDRLVFDPPLPVAVRAALGHIGAGQIAKVFCAFREPFWGRRRVFWTIGRPQPPIRLWVDASRLAGRPMLCGMATGAAARSLESCSPAALCALAARILGPAGL